MENEMICIVCPMGCRMILQRTGGEITIEGNGCPKGKTYALNETNNPTRMLQTTVPVREGFLCRLPIRTTSPIPKGRIMDCMDVIKKAEISAPVEMGDIIIENILGTGSDIIASRDMPAFPSIKGECDFDNESNFCSN
jgi:CxxC motif-containing protein